MAEVTTHPRDQNIRSQNDNERTNDEQPNNENLPTETNPTNQRRDMEQNVKIYIGASEKFKERYRNHEKSFRHKIYSMETELSKYIWTLKEKNINYSIKWKIKKKTSGYNKTTKSCSLCLWEKYIICTYKDKQSLLNKRNELISKCRHGNKFLLKYFH